MILIIFVSNSLLIQMGNNFSQQRGSSFDHYTSAPYLSTDPRLKVYVNNIGRTFIGKEVDLPYGDYHQMLSHSLKIKKQNMEYHILPISDCMFKPNNGFCSEQDKCLILCQQPQQNLSHLYQQRRLNNQRFSLNYVLSIIDRTAIALRRVQRFNEKIDGLDMSLIVFKGNESYLIDPLIISEEIEGNSLIQGKYPAPELLQWNKISQNNNDDLSANLFSLGVIAVALSFLHFNIDEIYTVRSTSLYGRKQLNYQFLGHLINLITHPELKERIMVLTHPQTMIRRNIYKIINSHPSLTQSTISQPLTPTRNKDIVKQSVIINRKIPVIPKDESRQLSRQTVERIVCKYVPVENRQKIINYPPSYQQNPLKVSQIQNQNISIKIASPPYQQPVKIVREVPRVKIGAATLSSSNKENQQSNYSRSKKNTVSSQLSITPKKPLVKHEFSTIKEVTQNEQDYSEHKLSQFKASLNFETVYQCNQVDGKKEGYGKCFFPEGSWYEGQWKNDQMHGYGKLYYSDGSLAYQGQWFNSEFHGNGKVYCLEPQLLRTPFDFRDFNTLEEEWVSYEGGLVRDKKHGWGIMILSNGQKYEGQFNNDSLEGHGTFYRMNGSSISGVWRQGRLVVGQQ